MSAFVPMGYITVQDALNHVGRELFPSDWTGEEHKARPGLLSEDEWSKVKDLAPAKGGGAEGGGRYQASKVQPKKAATPHWTGDPSDPTYQAEYRAYQRYAAARHELRVRLEAGRLEAAIRARSHAGDDRGLSLFCGHINFNRPDQHDRLANAFEQIADLSRHPA